MKKENLYFAMGNEAITAGALAAGARFFAGYPITPSSEIAELSSLELPKVGGLYVQMEDEIGSIAAIIGASAAGKRAYTATSGPGFSLMQENIGVSVAAEIPVVIIDVQRCGPSTGLATRAGQGDVMQAKWGTHGDHGVIVLCPASVQECYDLTIKAFNFADQYRAPVILLADEIIGHMREKYEKYPVKESDLTFRKQPVCAPEDYIPYDWSKEEDEVAPLASYGGKYHYHISGCMHHEYGTGCGTAENAAKFNKHYMSKIEKAKEKIIMTKSFRMEDAEIAIITFGGSVRSGLEAMTRARAENKKVGLFQIITMWPFPDEAVAQICDNVKTVLVPELNMGQVIREVERNNKGQAKVIGINRVDGESITPYQILDKINEVAE